MNVVEWLYPVPRTDSEYSFEVTDLTEVASKRPSSAELAELLRESYWNKDLLANWADRYGFEAVRDKFLQAHGKTRLSVRRGDFGEALSVEYLKKVEGYLVPVMKLRYKIVPNQTLPGTDCVAVKLSEEDEIIEVAFVESKLRTSLDTSVAVKGAKQLKQDADSTTPGILTFIAQRLRETNDPLASRFESYIFDRNIELDTYILIIFHEIAEWRERILSNLEDEAIELKPLHVYVAKIDDLKQMSDTAFATLSAEVIEDDDG